MLAVELDTDTDRRLRRIATLAGMSIGSLAREAIKAHLNDLEDFYIAEARLRNFRDRKAITLADLKAALGLAD